MMKKRDEDSGCDLTIDRPFYRTDDDSISVKPMLVVFIKQKRRRTYCNKKHIQSEKETSNNLRIHN